MENFLSQYIYVVYIAPVIAYFVYRLFKNGIQGEVRDDGTVVEESSSAVRILVLVFIIGGLIFFPLILFGTK